MRLIRCINKNNGTKILTIKLKIYHFPLSRLNLQKEFTKYFPTELPNYVKSTFFFIVPGKRHPKKKH